MRRTFAPLLASILIFSNAPTAEAHSTLVSSLPKSGATLKVAPKEVSLTFNEKLLVITGEHPTSLRVFSPAGISITSGALKVKANSVSISLKTLKAMKTIGKFKVAYRVVSADGHPISGEYFFTVK